MGLWKGRGRNNWGSCTLVMMGYCFKGHSQLEHMSIRYHFIANLHVTEIRSILVLVKYDKNNVTG